MIQTELWCLERWLRREGTGIAGCTASPCLPESVYARTPADSSMPCGRSSWGASFVSGCSGLKGGSEGRG
jgi:hypothetical protein